MLKVLVSGCMSPCYQDVIPLKAVLLDVYLAGPVKVRNLDAFHIVSPVPPNLSEFSDRKIHRWTCNNPQCENGDHEWDEKMTKARLKGQHARTLLQVGMIA